jgi:hypothetical protein
MREIIYYYVFNLRPKASIRVPTAWEEDRIRDDPTSSLTYQNPAGAFSSTQLLGVADLFASNRSVAREMSEWLTRTFTMHVNTYEPSFNPAHGDNDAANENWYPPFALRATLPLVRYTGHVKHLEIDLKWLVGIPSMLAGYCNEADVTSVRLTFGSLSSTKAHRGYYHSFKEVVLELWELQDVCVQKEVKIVWVEMENTFMEYTVEGRR